MPSQDGRNSESMGVDGDFPTNSNEMRIVFRKENRAAATLRAFVYYSRRFFVLTFLHTSEDVF